MLLTLGSRSSGVLHTGLGSAWEAGGKSRGWGLVPLNHKVSGDDFHSKHMGTQSEVLGRGEEDPGALHTMRAKSEGMTTGPGP